MGGNNSNMGGNNSNRNLNMDGNNSNTNSDGIAYYRPSGSQSLLTNIIALAA